MLPSQIDFHLLISLKICKFYSIYKNMINVLFPSQFSLHLWLSFLPLSVFHYLNSSTTNFISVPASIDYCIHSLFRFHSFDALITNFNLIPAPIADCISYAPYFTDCISCTVLITVLILFSTFDPSNCFLLPAALITDLISF